MAWTSTRKAWPCPSPPSDSTEVRHYGTIGGRLEDLDRVIKKLQSAAPEVELRFCYEAGPTGYPLCRHLRRGVRAVMNPWPPAPLGLPPS